ncbi:YheC/YheD family endospore coat-associated protein [Paenibacillus spongiae]|uniref:YheC/YheD family protein n=1 Tax=Paenibacillus spongiae TaxID=2909671 RepID=A0ABY5SEG3_9BACL|nr:YheC/YheD family protein [Paenibacillus spongiae]UVI31880.1 YheC/YheD family protein [Paenibacillus spongiae]
MPIEPQDPQDSVDILSKKPVLAILTIDDDIQLFRGNRSNYADLIRIGREHGFLVYVVTIKQLKLKRKVLDGYTYQESSDAWQLQQFPFPDLIYNRIPQREDELLPMVRQKIAACMRSPHVQLFNPKFFNKWSLFKWLRQSSTTRPYIPSTQRMLTRESLANMMRKHTFLYLKPISGKAGKGIMTIKVQPERSLPYKLKVQANKKSLTYSCGTLQKLWVRVKKECGGERYIAQQGIMLAAYNDRRFDLRALVQKNQRGIWELSGIGARVAGSFSITTHVPRGGSIEDPEKLLVSAFGQEEARKLLMKARITSLLIAKQIERGAGYTLAEMSMDLGVDQHGNLWFFEANAKPMKFDEPDIRRLSLERIFHYGRYLIRTKSS